MPRSKVGAKRTPIPKGALERAIELLIKNEKSVRQVAADLEISKTTLLRHKKKFLESGLEKFCYNPNNDVRKIFTENEEKLLVDYILKAADLQYGLTLKDVRVLAYQFAKANNKKIDKSWEEHKMAGEFWLRLFRKKHSDQLSLRKPEATSLARSTAFNRANVALTFENIKKAYDKNPGLTANNLWNVDETGVSTVHVPPKILAKKGQKQVGSMTSAERGTTVTMIGAINAGGGFMPPMLIFPRKNFKDYMIKGAPVGTIGGANPSGWSNEELFFCFMQHFIKHSRSSKENTTILLMDNAESHISVRTIQLAKDSGVTLVTLHPHTSNKMQPLDRTVYGPFKTYYYQAMNDWMLNVGNAGKPVTIYEVAELVKTAFILSFTPSNILSGFQACGIYPLNENIFADHEFLPSSVTDRPNPITEEPINEDHELYVNDFDHDPGSNNQAISLPSTSDGVKNSQTTPNHNSASASQKTVVSPEDLRPYPKAQPRKGTYKGRPKKKSCILTDTPVKMQIEEQKLAKNKTEAIKIKKKQPCKKIFKKTLFWDVESDDCETEEESKIIYAESGESEESFGDLEDPDFETIKSGVFVLVQIKGKMANKHFVAEVTEVCDTFLKIQYLKKDANSEKFTRDDKTIYELDKGDVLHKLPHPFVSGGSARQLEKLSFGVDFSEFNMG